MQGLQTQKQTDRTARNKAILAKFKTFRSKYPDVSLERIFVEISKDYNITSGAIRAVCKGAGLC